MRLCRVAVSLVLVLFPLTLRANGTARKRAEGGQTENGRAEKSAED